MITGNTFLERIVKRRLSKKEQGTRAFLFAVYFVVSFTATRVFMPHWLSAHMPEWAAKIDIALLGACLILMAHIPRVYAGFWFVAGLGCVAITFNQASARKVSMPEIEAVAICIGYFWLIYLWKAWETLWGQKILRGRDD